MTPCSLITFLIIFHHKANKASSIQRRNRKFGNEFSKHLRIGTARGQIRQKTEEECKQKRVKMNKSNVGTKKSQSPATAQAYLPRGNYSPNQWMNSLTDLSL